MITIKHIKDVPITIAGVTGTEESMNVANSCMLCPSTHGVYKVYDDVKKEAYYLCEKHRICFDDNTLDLKLAVKIALAIDQPSIDKANAEKNKPDIFTEAVNGKTPKLA